MAGPVDVYNRKWTRRTLIYPSPRELGEVESTEQFQGERMEKAQDNQTFSLGTA